MTLQDLLEDVAAELDDVEEIELEGGIEWRRGGRPFAAAAGDTAEFLLQPPVAAAAIRTPDTRPSPRGAGWVAFAPGTLDEPAADRAEAWLTSAWRHAA
jgi:hypothetical protein